MGRWEISCLSAFQKKKKVSKFFLKKPIFKSSQIMTINVYLLRVNTRNSLDVLFRTEKTIYFSIDFI